MFVRQRFRVERTAPLGRLLTRTFRRLGFAVFDTRFARYDTLLVSVAKTRTIFWVLCFPSTRNEIVRRTIIKLIHPDPPEIVSSDMPAA